MPSIVRRVFITYSFIHVHIAIFYANASFVRSHERHMGTVSCAKCAQLCTFLSISFFDLLLRSFRTSHICQEPVQYPQRTHKQILATLSQNDAAAAAAAAVFSPALCSL